MKTWMEQHRIMKIPSLVEGTERAGTAIEKEMERGGAVEAPAVVITVKDSLLVMDLAATVPCTV